MTGVASNKWFLPLDFGAERWRRGEGTNALHLLRVQQRSIQSARSSLPCKYIKVQLDIYFS